MKKIIEIISIILVLSLMSFGCTTSTDEARQDKTRSGVTNNGDNLDIIDENGGTYNGITRNGVYDFKYDYDNNNIDNDNLSNDQSGYSRDNWLSSLGDLDTIDMIEGLCSRQENVEDASVVVNDDTCYVGLDIEDGSKLSENMKEELSTEIKRAEPNIRRVYFTEDVNVIDEFIKNADSMNIDWNSLEDMFK